ncbi:MAG: hypothetical protein LBL07_04290 [Tannerella sp.]|nr:hypothetical protein [Tannerella sp.]
MSSTITANLQGVSLSCDGLPEAHDRHRVRPQPLPGMLCQMDMRRQLLPQSHNHHGRRRK